MKNKSIFPLCLLSQNRRCLMVGGGKVALRKIKLLLDCDAAVTVVSPEVRDELNELVEERRVLHIPREFEPGDVSGAVLVFAATNIKPVNRRVLECCHDQNVLCCCVDGNWTDGDFVTPAIFRKDELIISVSTGGRSCRRSRLIKENLSRHVEMVETADLIVMGASHHEMSIDEREPYHLVGQKMERVGRMLMMVWGIHEFALLNTCNRVELIAVATRDQAINEVLEHIMGFDHLELVQYYFKRGFEAFCHLTMVSAGLYSQTPGEYHIVAQLKEALDNAVKAGWAAGMLQEWFGSSLHISKHIRTEIDPKLQDFEIEDLSLGYLMDCDPGFEGKRVMVIGAGIVGHGIVDRLCKRGIACEWCYHRRRPELDETMGDLVRLGSFNMIRERLPDMDVILCATGASGHVLHQGHAPFFDQEKNVVIVDLAMPRNVAPELNNLSSGLNVVDLDDLKHWYRREQIDVPALMRTGRKAVHEHRDMYEKIIQSFQGRNENQQSGLGPDA